MHWDYKEGNINWCDCERWIKVVCDVSISKRLFIQYCWDVRWRWRCKACDCAVHGTDKAIEPFKRNLVFICVRRSKFDEISQKECQIELKLNGVCSWQLYALDSSSSNMGVERLLKYSPPVHLFIRMMPWLSNRFFLHLVHVEVWM